MCPADGGRGIGSLLCRSPSPAKGCWFPGCHSSAAGGHRDEPEPCKAQTQIKWRQSPGAGAVVGVVRGTVLGLTRSGLGHPGLFAAGVSQGAGAQVSAWNSWGGTGTSHTLLVTPLLGDCPQSTQTPLSCDPLSLSQPPRLLSSVCSDAGGAAPPRFVIAPLPCQRGGPVPAQTLSPLGLARAAPPGTHR